MNNHFVFVPRNELSPEVRAKLPPYRNCIVKVSQRWADTDAKARQDALVAALVSEVPAASKQK